jgi:hypothetical protein
MHRVVLGLGPGDPGVDHVNGNGLDNQRTNLRLASAVQNGGNRRKTSKPTTSRFKGVTWDKARRHWRAEIKVNGKNHYLGYFDTEEEAASAYDTAATEAFGEYAYRNGGPSF